MRPDALASRDGKTVLFVIRDGKAVEVPVTPGAKVGDVTSITGAVKSGRSRGVEAGTGSERRRAGNGRDEMIALLLNSSGMVFEWTPSADPKFWRGLRYRQALA